MDLNTLGMVATEAALTEGDEWLDEARVYLDGNFDLVETYIRDNIPLLKYAKARGTYLAWLDVSDVIETIGAVSTAADESESSGQQVTPESIVQRWFAENARVYMNPGSSYGTGGAGNMRMNIATTRRLVGHALENMADALARA
jgi:cystathionine beta-lyase